MCKKCGFFNWVIILLIIIGFVLNYMLLFDKKNAPYDGGMLEEIMWLECEIEELKKENRRLWLSSKEAP